MVIVQCLISLTKCRFACIDNLLVSLFSCDCLLRRLFPASCFGGGGSPSHLRGMLYIMRYGHGLPQLSLWCPLLGRACAAAVSSGFYSRGTGSSDIPGTALPRCSEDYRAGGSILLRRILLACLEAPRPALRGSGSLYLSEGMLRGILPLIPNLQFGYLYDFGNNRVSSGRFTADYLLPFSLSPDSMIFGEAHTEFQDFWKTRSFNNRVDMSFGGRIPHAPEGAIPCWE